MTTIKSCEFKTKTFLRPSNCSLSSLSVKTKGVAHVDGPLEFLRLLGELLLKIGQLANFLVGQAVVGHLDVYAL